MKHNVQRFVQPFDHAKPFWSYLSQIAYGWLPWTVVAGVDGTIRNRMKGTASTPLGAFTPVKPAPAKPVDITFVGPKPRTESMIIKGYTIVEGTEKCSLLSKVKITKTYDLTMLNPASQAIIRKWAADRLAEEDIDPKFPVDASIETAAYPYFLDPALEHVFAKVTVAYPGTKVPDSGPAPVRIRSYAKQLYVYDNADRKTRQAPGGGPAPARPDSLPVDSVSYLWAGLLSGYETVARTVSKDTISISRHYLQEHEEDIVVALTDEEPPRTNPAVTVFDYDDGYTFRDVYMRLTERGQFVSVGHGSRPANPTDAAGIFLENHHWHLGFTPNPDLSAPAPHGDRYPLPPLGLYSQGCILNHCYSKGVEGVVHTGVTPVRSMRDAMMSGLALPDTATFTVKGHNRLCVTEFNSRWAFTPGQGIAAVGDYDAAAAVMRSADAAARLPGGIGDPLFEMTPDEEVTNGRIDNEVWAATVANRATVAALAPGTTTADVVISVMKDPLSPGLGATIPVTFHLGQIERDAANNIKITLLGTAEATAITHTWGVTATVVRSTIVIVPGAEIVLLSPRDPKAARWGGPRFHFRWFLHNYEIENGGRTYRTVQTPRGPIYPPNDSRFHQIEALVHAGGDWLRWQEGLHPKRPDGYSSISTLGANDP